MFRENWQRQIKFKSTSLKHHKRSLPLNYFSSDSQHAIPFLLRSNILPINMLHYKSVSVLMHNIIDHDLVPSNLKNLFTRIASTHSHNSRAAAAGKFHAIRSRTKQQDQLLSRLGARYLEHNPRVVKITCCLKPDKVGAVLMFSGREFQILYAKYLKEWRPYETGGSRFTQRKFFQESRL